MVKFNPKCTIKVRGKGVVNIRNLLKGVLLFEKPRTVISSGKVKFSPKYSIVGCE
jgi:hypothetical protein